VKELKSSFKPNKSINDPVFSKSDYLGETQGQPSDSSKPVTNIINNNNNINNFIINNPKIEIQQ
jgi:hypothetical protein